MSVLLVSHRCACRSSQRDDLTATKTCLFAPVGELGASEIKCFAKFNEHVQRHHKTEGVLPTFVVDDVLDGDQRAADWQCTERLGYEHLLVFEIPVMKDHSHCDDICFGKFVREEVDRLGDDLAIEISLSHPAFRDRPHLGEIAGPALHMRMARCDHR